MTDPILLQQLNNQATVNRFTVDQTADMNARAYARGLRFRKGAEIAEAKAMIDNAEKLKKLHERADRKGLLDYLPDFKVRRAFGINTDRTEVAPKNAPEAPGIINDPLNKVRELLNNRPLGDVHHGAESTGIAVTDGGQHAPKVVTNGDRVKDFVSSAWEGLLSAVKVVATSVAALFTGGAATGVAAATVAPVTSPPAEKPVTKGGVAAGLDDSKKDLGNLVSPLPNGAPLPAANISKTNPGLS